ncbi:MAG: CARDB domain-containing protein [Pseudomonadota bacterium]
MFKMAILAAAATAVSAVAAVAQPNLTATLNPNTGQIIVQNTGAVAAAASWVTVECNGDCPEPPAAQLAAYLNPAFPNRLSVNLPALAPSQSFNHGISFWNSLAFPAGKAIFRVCADDGDSVAESSERDNCANVLRRQAPAKVRVPTPTNKLRLRN